MNASAFPRTCSGVPGGLLPGSGCFSRAFPPCLGRPGASPDPAGPHSRLSNQIVIPPPGRVRGLSAFSQVKAPDSQAPMFAHPLRLSSRERSSLIFLSLLGELELTEQPGPGGLQLRCRKSMGRAVLPRHASLGAAAGLWASPLPPWWVLPLRLGSHLPPFLPLLCLPRSLRASQAQTRLL